MFARDIFIMKNLSIFSTDMCSCSLGKSLVSNGVTSRGMLSNDSCITKELEEIQEKHICGQVRRCLKPLRICLSLIGRFPYTIHAKKKATTNKKHSHYSNMFRKLTRFSKDCRKDLIKTGSEKEKWNSLEKMENGKSFDEVGDQRNDSDLVEFEKDDYCYVYNPCSFRSSVYYMITIMTLICIGKPSCITLCP